MSCQMEQVADCSDISTLSRALFVLEVQDPNWLSQCCISMSSCGNLLSVGLKDRLCLLASHWINSNDSNTFLISWSGTLPNEIATILVLPILSSSKSSQNGPDWHCVIVGFKNGSVGFYTDTGHLLFLKKFDDSPAIKISCHTGPYGTLSDDVQILFQNAVYFIPGPILFQTLRTAKSHLARVKAGVQNNYVVDGRELNIRKWLFVEQELINDGALVGLELKNTYDHLLAASTYGGYNTWYRSIPPMNNLILVAGVKPYIGFQYALEGGNVPPLQDVAIAVANKIKSALPGWLGGTTEAAAVDTEHTVKSEPLIMRNSIYDSQRYGTAMVISPDRRLAAAVDNIGRVAVLDVQRGHIIRLFKGYRDAQCGFIQIFENDDKRAQLSVIKEKKRAIFLIIYNPKKGLIDIRLMQSGTRIAVFTAARNGKLVYNTCGLVGAEKSYTHRKLNLPDFQCVLIDPDGKIKKFNIPFFYALDAEHSARSKDLHILRELRDYVKTLNNFPETGVPEDVVNEINQRLVGIKTTELKKYCLEMLIKKYNFPPKLIICAMNIFWDYVTDVDFNEEHKSKIIFFTNLTLATLFYRRINNESTEDMQDLICRMHPYITHNAENYVYDKSYEHDENIAFHLLEDDTCISERLLILAQESNYKELQTKVKFSDVNASQYKDFLYCFDLEEKSDYLSLKSDISKEKVNCLASDIFKSVFAMDDFSLLSNIIVESNLDPNQIIKLCVIYIMNVPLVDVNIELIEKFIKIIYYSCSIDKAAVNIIYSEVSPWWQIIRDNLVETYCPLRSMIVAMACKAVSKILEKSSLEEDAWETVSRENAEWGLLIGKLEDISILSIVILHKNEFTVKHLPKLQNIEFIINLKYIYSRGNGSVTELIAKWLCSMGVLPEAIIANELMETILDSDANDINKCDDINSLIFLDEYKILVEKNTQIFKWISLLKRQFPFSTSANYVIANMCWEYAIAWQKDINRMELFSAVIHCINFVKEIHLRIGLYSMVWSTCIKDIFGHACRLVNKVGKLPKELFCLQDVGLNDSNMLDFLETTTKFLEGNTKSASQSTGTKNHVIQYEKIWGDNVASLVEIALAAKVINYNIVNVLYQISCTVYYQCRFAIKFSKPLDTLFDIEYHHLLEASYTQSTDIQITTKPSSKVRSYRMKFLTKLIRAAVETISYTEEENVNRIYNNQECIIWVRKFADLAENWGIEEDFVTHQQVIAFYHRGFDELAEELIGSVKEPTTVLASLVAITTQRLKRSLERSSNQSEWIVTVPPHLYKRLQNTPLDLSIPAHPSLVTTVAVLRKLLYEIEKRDTQSTTSQDIKLAELIIDTCNVLVRRNL